MQFIDFIKEYVPDVSQLRLRKTAVNERKQTVDFVFVSLIPLSKEKEEAVRRLCGSYLGDEYTVNVSFEKDTLTAASVKTCVDKYINENRPSLAARIKGEYTAAKKGNGYSVVFRVDSLTEKIIEDMGFLQELRAYFDTLSAIEVDFSLNSYSLVRDEEALKLKIMQYQQLQQSRELSRPKRYTDVRNVSVYIGKEITGRPRYISDITEPTQRCIAAGRITAKKTYVSDKITSTICKFNLTDYTGTVPAVFFAKKDALKKFETLNDGEQVILSAAAQRNAINGEIELKVFDISKCEMLKESEQTKYINEVPSSYVVLSPQKIVIEKQLALEEHSKAVPYFLREHDIVLITLLTTGQRIFQDKIIKISAVKIAGGEIAQSFESYINPEKVLDDDFLKQNDMTEINLRDFHSITDILPDLYKFCYGCTIVAQNSEIVMGFLKYYANAAKYLFSNEVLDFENVAKNFFSQGEFAGQRFNNYSLQKVAEKLNIKIPPRESDSLSFARVFLRMCYLYDKLFQNT